MDRTFGVNSFFVWCFCAILVSSQTPNLDWKFDPFSTNQWFKQKLDHYDSSNVQYWPQRYITSYRYYRLGGPIFLFLSGPGPELTLNDVESGAIAAYAEEQGAFVIGFEHRFYGKSKPTTDLSTKNLHYLTIPQTIEDIAAFIRTWRARDDFRNSKWVLFGASYLGSLATWFAQNHPELIDAFVASSAPLELRYEIPEFLENVGNTLNETDPKCYDVVADTFTCLTRIFNDQGCESYTLEDLKNKFEFCSDLDTSRPLDATGVIAELFSTVNAVVMYHDPDPESFPDTNLDQFCKHVTAEQSGKTSLEKIAEKVKQINKHRGLTCAEFRFQTTVDYLKEEEWDSAAAKEGYRQLQWQLCNELGWTVASANISQPFGNYLNPFLHAEVCQKLFGLSETEMRLKVLKANTELGGKNVKTKCGIFVNGDMDPWHTFSITTPQEAGQCNRAVLIEGGSHARDIEDFTNTPSHPPQVRKAQLKIATYLDAWLRTGKCCDEEATSESRKVISSLSRSSRGINPREYYATVSEMLVRPNVQIRPHSYPSGAFEKRMIASPTSVPYQVSTTDVLSVSPRIPVIEEHSVIKSQEPRELNGDIYRDPRNAEYRKYRVVKLLRHRQPTESPTTAQPSWGRPPSMEQFEADFPEHNIRVEGRVERVFKNGTIINPPEPPLQIASPQVVPESEELELFDRGRRLLIQTASPSPNELVEPEPTNENEKGGNEAETKKGRFRFVVKQIFKDIVDPNPTNPGNSNANKQLGEQTASNSKEAPDEHSRNESADNPEIAAKSQQTPESSTYQTSQNDSKSSTDVGDDLSASLSSEYASHSGKGPTKVKDSSAPKKRESGESSNSGGSSSFGDHSEYDSLSSSESSEHSHGRAPGKAINSSDVIVKVTSKGITPGEKTKEDDDDIYDDEYPDDFYDDYYDSDESDEKQGRRKGREESKSDSRIKKDKQEVNASRKVSTGISTRSKTNTSRKETKVPAELTSGEDTRPRRLREKISEKIMSSSEAVEGDQKSKEKTKKHRQRGEAQNNEADEMGDDEENLAEQPRSRTQEIFSDEDYNYSLEPSGSDPQRSYRKSKKQLEPLPKPVIEEPGTIINVEISGSYPRRKKKTKKTTTTEAPPQEVEKSEEVEAVTDDEAVGETSTPKPKRKKSHRRRRPKPERTTTSTTQATTMSTTTEPPTTSTTTEPVKVDSDEYPPTNNYEGWNLHEQSKPIQQESPTVLPLENTNENSNTDSSPPAPNNNGDNVMYIIIGDIPNDTDGKSNLVDENTSHTALFNLIQKLVSRHSAGLFNNPSGPPAYYPPTQPPPTLPPTTTSTTTEAPPPPPFPVLPGGHYDKNIGRHVGKYLLIRPVQVVSLGREHVVHASDLKNDSLLDVMTMDTPYRQYSQQSQMQNMRRLSQDQESGYRFKSPVHREQFEKLLSVDDQVRDSDREEGAGYFYQPNQNRRLDEIEDPTWRSIRGISQFGPASSPQASGSLNSGLLGLSAADTMWVNNGVPFIPRHGRQFSKRHVN